jgi:hypothetical protein
MCTENGERQADDAKLVRSQIVAAETPTVRDGQLRENATIPEAERQHEREWVGQLEQNRQEAEQL